MMFGVGWWLTQPVVPGPSLPERAWTVRGEWLGAAISRALFSTSKKVHRRRALGSEAPASKPISLPTQPVFAPLHALSFTLFENAPTRLPRSFPAPSPPPQKTTDARVHPLTLYSTARIKLTQLAAGHHGLRYRQSLRQHRPGAGGGQHRGK
jgi:hypothetical protein